MSVLRRLSPIKYALPFGHDSPKKTCEKISLEIHLPTLGSIFMKPPDDPLWPHARSAGPRDDQLLSGVLEIHVPPTASGSGRRCKSVRVGLRTIARLDMGPGRGWEEDTIFERKVEMMGGNAEGIVLDPGVQIFEFTLILPSTLAPHDWHPNGKVTQELFAELEGLPEPESPAAHALHLFGLGQRRSSKSSHTSKRGSFSAADGGSTHHSGPASPSSSPRSASPSLSPMITAAGSLSITRQESPSSAPSYEQSQAETTGAGPATDQDWIVGQYETVKCVMVLHNPNSAGTSSDLDLRQSGYVPGIGVWDLKIFSDVFSIGAPIHARLTLASLDPGTTIFMWRLQLRQTVTVTSPRDDPATSKPISTSRQFTLIHRGTRPEYVRAPGREYDAIWRGKGAEGEDEGEFMTSGSANMPRDDAGRPTTLPGLVTPIKVSHTLVYEVYFSVWGEDDRGGTMAKPGPGGLRYMQVSKPLILPSCALIPSLLDLPKYEKCEGNEPCAECGGTADDPTPICLTCPPTAIAHPAHDYEASLAESEGSSSGKFKGLKRRLRICAECAIKHHSTEFDIHSWRLCACGLDAGDIAGRMAKFVTEGLCRDAESERLGQKEVAERRKRRQG